ncbi:anthrax toxin-like adenylyl cyclase domain-containing protein [Methylomarinum vadi]|uniref:anthrax toxin-like adenylyl cyclase domain-containing protein n=1 Tax=Methylomarinum vadi TaxID=438855 RepID=UPI001363C5B9|nr:anthrax toxin-like adenylyl cyclase domain-containing protein [Methylomarinum vadi]
MNINDANFLEFTIGMPRPHMQAFLTVARQQQCIIIVRATGPTCHGLLEEGYDTKGYRIHGKSCDWGPMAGFVMRDPRLNKYGMGKAGFNRAKHREALVLDNEGQGWKASVTPLKISQRRIDWLMTHGYINPVRKGDRLDGTATHPSGISFKYSLIPEPNNPGLFGVYFDQTELHNRWMQEKGGAVVHYHPKYGASYEPMLAMTNPPGHRSYRGETYLNAITGDYDLFAIWPFVGSYDASAYGLDHRPLGTVKGSVTQAERDNVENLERHFTEGGQGTKLGNITPRIYLICQLVNSIIAKQQVLWHSDEAARPFLDDVDLPVMAFTPAGNYVGIESIFDFKVFISYCDEAGIKVTLSNAWAQEPTAQKPNRLGASYAGYVPADGVRIIVPDWYNA